jgi:hypothetical protein
MATQPDTQPDIQPAWQPPTLEEFLVDIKSRQSRPAFPPWDNTFLLTNHPAETRQENDPSELIVAPDMAPNTTRMFAECSPTMA